MSSLQRNYLQLADCELIRERKTIKKETRFDKHYEAREKIRALRQGYIIDILSKEPNLTNEQIRRKLMQEYQIEFPTNKGLAYHLLRLVKKGELVSKQ